MKSSSNNGSRQGGAPTQFPRCNSRVPVGAGRAGAFGSGKKSLSTANTTISTKLGITFATDSLVAQPIPVLAAGRPGNFIDFHADIYCPVQVDPAGNRHWKRNVN